MGWIDEAARIGVADVAGRLGIELRRGASSHHGRCPSCGAKRRHQARGDRRGAVGIPHSRPTKWNCFACGAHGDSIDFVAYAMFNSCFPDLPPERKREVRAWFDGQDGARFVPQSDEPAPPSYPPTDEVHALWFACVPVMDVRCASDYLTFRRISPGRVAELDLARALPATAHLPDWARFGVRTWLESGHRVIVPLFDAQGRLRSVLARSVERDPHVKSVGARGYQRGGLVMADRLGCGMLTLGRAPRWWPGGKPFGTVIREGEIDYMHEATRERQGPAPAVLGIVSGSWTPAHAERVPTGSVVVVATDPDAAGDKYAETIASTLRDRVRIVRRREVP